MKKSIESLQKKVDDIFTDIRYHRDSICEDKEKISKLYEKEFNNSYIKKYIKASIIESDSPIYMYVKDGYVSYDEESRIYTYYLDGIGFSMNYTKKDGASYISYNSMFEINYRFVYIEEFKKLLNQEVTEITKEEYMQNLNLMLKGMEENIYTSLRKNKLI